jgi:hypothetical protein
MYYVPGQFVPGSIARFKSKRYGHLLHHWGVIDWPDVFSGEERAIHSEKGSVVKTASLFDFAEGEALEILWVPESAEQQASMLQRMHSLEGKPYDLFLANCEQVVRWALTGESVSEQLRVAGVVAGLGLAAWALSKSARK